jgi:hypothetical protein
MTPGSGTSAGITPFTFDFNGQIHFGSFIRKLGKPWRRYRPRIKMVRRKALLPRLASSCAIDPPPPVLRQGAADLLFRDLTGKAGHS